MHLCNDSRVLDGRVHGATSGHAPKLRGNFVETNILAVQMLTRLLPTILNLSMMAMGGLRMTAI